jgi:ABC-type transport system substrate-binding protein
MLRRWIMLGAMALSACSPQAEDEAVRVAFVGTPAELAETGLRLSYPAQQLRAATAQGLVRLDETGEVVPGIAQSWIVTDDGLSYIFRVRDATWPDGSPITAEQVRRQLIRAIRDLEGSTLGLDLEKVAEVRAMTGRVVEIELESPMAQFLRLVAQPELGIVHDGQTMGPMRPTAKVDSMMTLSATPPQERGLPEEPNWRTLVQPLRITAMPAERAVAAFGEGQLDMVLGGTLVTLPLLDTGPLARGTVRLDAAVGTFGFDVTPGTGFLADPTNREAVAMAIDRTALLEPFNIEGWTLATRIVPPDLPGGPRQNAERWTALDLPTRRAIARGRVQAWQSDNGEVAPLSISMPAGPGSDILLRQLAADLATVGLRVAPAKSGERADLTLRDKVARYGQARWFLNQFNCGIARGLCAPEADELVRRANASLDAATRGALLAQAEDVLTARNLFIPLGAPVRWSLVRSGIDGFSENPWAVHPLFPLSGAPM